MKIFLQYFDRILPRFATEKLLLYRHLAIFFRILEMLLRYFSNRFLLTGNPSNVTIYLRIYLYVGKSEGVLHPAVAPTSLSQQQKQYHQQHLRYYFSQSLSERAASSSDLPCKQKHCVPVFVLYRTSWIGTVVEPCASADPR